MSDQEQPVYSIGVVERTVGIPVIALSTGRIGDRESRTLRVLELRGSPAASGAHAYRISVGGFGWTLQQPAVELMYRSSVDVYIDEWVYDLLETVERVGARRVLIDSLSDLQFAAPDAIRSSASPTFPTTSSSSNMCATAAPSAAR